MKKFLLTAATAAAALTAFSADKFYVIMKDGSVESYPTEKVDSISFNDPQIEKIMGFGDMMQEIAKLKEEIAALKAGSGMQDTSVSDLRYFIINDKEVKVTGFNNGSSDLVIPEKTILNGKEYTVVGIGSEAFKDLEIKSVTLPKTLKKIGDDAFSGCESLTSIEIPSSVTSIGMDAFAICSSLTSIEIPSSVTSIGWGAFSNCKNLDVVIDNAEDNVKVEHGALGDCKSVKWTKGSSPKPDLKDENEDENESQTNVVASPKISVEAGGEYEAISDVFGIAFTFKVVKTEGSYLSKNQEVTITIDGYDGELTLSDAGDSYLMFDDSGFVTVGRATAIENPMFVFAVLACANSTGDYTITSPTVDDTMRANGAFEITFRKKN